MIRPFHEPPVSAHTCLGLDCADGWKLRVSVVSCPLPAGRSLVVRHSHPRSSSRTLLVNYPLAATHSTFFFPPSLHWRISQMAPKVDRVESRLLKD